MQRITKEQFEQILFNTDISITEQRSFKRSSIKGKRQAVIKLVSNGVVIAKREITPEGNFYYQLGE